MNRITAVLSGFCLAAGMAAVSCAGAPERAGAVPERAVSPPAPALPPYAGDGVSLDQALADIAAYYGENLPANTRIALLSFESDSPLLSGYIFEELSIHFENSRSFVLVDRQNLELIQRELEYQLSGKVSDESAQSIGRQFGPQTLVYGKITPLGGEYRLVVHATDVERAVTSIRSATVIPGRRFAALLEPASGGAAGMADALYSGAGNPWRFTVRTDRSDGDYRDGDYMTLRVYSEKDAWFRITHIDVNGNAQV
ncbi:MAG: CsgG/HfaB family protein, partial [Treponema sp.]|nr:CsgG/HfaB family protein [Treponema sp.]